MATKQLVLHFLLHSLLVNLVVWTLLEHQVAGQCTADSHCTPLSDQCLAADSEETANILTTIERKMKQESHLLEEMKRQLHDHDMKLENVTASILSTIERLIEQELGQRRKQEVTTETSPAMTTHPLSVPTLIYTSTPRLVHTISGNGIGRGVTSLGDKVYVVWDGAEAVDVYDVNTFSPQPRLPVPGLIHAWDIASSERYNCLYILDFAAGGIMFRVELTGSVTSWPMGSVPRTMSVTANNNIIVTFHSTSKMKEFTHDGHLIRELNLPNTALPQHTIQLSSGQLLVAHDSRVCIVDDAGSVTQCYGGQEGSGSGQIGVARYLIADQQGRILVADSRNHRVLLLSPSLTYIRVLISPRSGLRDPLRMFLDQTRGLLYFAYGNKGDEVLIFKVSES